MRTDLRKGKPVVKNKVNIKVDNMNQISVRKKSGEKRKGNEWT